MSKLVRDALDLMYRTAALHGLDLLQVEDGRWILLMESDYPLPLKAMTSEEMSSYLFRELVMLYEEDLFCLEPEDTEPSTLKALMLDPAGMFQVEAGGAS